MLGVAQTRARQLGRTVHLRQADAHALPFPDAVFDTVVCTFALCAIPDERRAVGEMIRVLRPGGLVLLADHIVGGSWPVRAVQRAAEVITVPLQGSICCAARCARSKPKGSRSSGANASSSERGTARRPQTRRWLAA
jgi:ubiquinone/menaquinone biosynthesis C-methylase UbiE